MKEQIWENVLSLKKSKPLVHNITNYVVMNTTANALLAAGASPIMAHAHSEMEEMVGLASSLVINIGTLDEYWRGSMFMAAQYAQRAGKPWILDPVGAGATPLRDQAVERMLQYGPSAIRGNASEIMAVAKTNKQATKGVDSVYGSGDALDAAKLISNEFACVVTVSGERDIIVSKDKTAIIANGHALMALVTGLGCTASALIGAFLAVQEDAFLASVSAMALLGICGQLAAQEAQGPGSLQLHIVDKLYTITEEEFYALLKLEENA